LEPSTVGVLVKTTVTTTTTGRSVELHGLADPT
jgi:hypothetical protein